MSSCFCFAKLPQSIKTRPSRLFESSCITLSVNCSQPISRCDAGFPASTVNIAFKRNTPCVAHLVRSPCDGWSVPMSSFISLKIFCSDGGGFFSFRH